MYNKIFEVVLEKNSFKLKIYQTKISKPPPHIQTKIERKKRLFNQYNKIHTSSG